MKGSLWLKIFVPVFIVTIILGMWLLKTQPNSPAVTHPTAPTFPSGNPLAGADFSLHATTQIDFSALSQYGLPIIADYGSDSCVPCKQMYPVLEKLNEEMFGKAFIKFMDIWEYPDEWSNVPIYVIPSQIIFTAEGTPYIPSEEMSAQINFNMIYDDAGNHIFTIHQGGLTEDQMRAILQEMGVG